jgi:cob(I)alamin adenosyltransferase
MRPKLSKNIDEVCYPFMYEKSLKCDFEILTDELCRQIGGILAVMPPEFPELVAELEALQPLIYHLNGSIRGKCALTEAHLVWLRECYVRHRDASADSIAGFVLPRGAAPVPQLNSASSAAKRAIRLMVRMHDEEAIEIPDVLHRFCNVLCNYLFTLTVVINRARGEREIPFISESYRVRTPRKGCRPLPLT